MKRCMWVEGRRQSLLGEGQGHHFGGVWCVGGVEGRSNTEIGNRLHEASVSGKCCYCGGCNIVPRSGTVSFDVYFVPVVCVSMRFGMMIASKELNIV